MNYLSLRFLYLWMSAVSLFQLENEIEEFSLSKSRKTFEIVLDSCPGHFESWIPRFRERKWGKQIYKCIGMDFIPNQILLLWQNLVLKKSILLAEVTLNLVRVHQPWINRTSKREQHPLTQWLSMSLRRWT